MKPLAMGFKLSVAASLQPTESGTGYLFTHGCIVEERRAPAAEDIGARRRRWTIDLTDSQLKV